MAIAATRRKANGRGMRIGLVSPYDFAYPGGVTRHVSHLATEFRKRGHEVHVLAPSSSASDTMVDQLTLHPFGRVVSIPTNGSVARIELSIRPYAQVKRFLKELEFDIIHLQEPLMPALPPTVLRHSKATNIGTFHAYRRSNFAYFYAKLVAQPFFNKLHGLIAVSRPARDFVAEYFPGDYRIIPNGVDFDRFAAPIEPLPQLSDGRLNVLFVGRLEKRKGLKHLLRAWGYVRSQFTDVRLIIVGEGRPRQGYERYATSRGWDEVVFAGYVSDEDLVRYYQSADVFCAPSTGQESFGIVLLEAMAAGCPIVASRIAGYDEVVTHDGEGILVEPKNEGELGAALTRLLADKAKRRKMGLAGQRKARQYRWDRIAERVLAYYDEVLAIRRLQPESERVRFRRMRRAAADVANLLVR
jgi:phosphatidyl-myo-inositol alpha-mannosyltransferase